MLSLAIWFYLKLHPIRSKMSVVHIRQCFRENNTLTHFIIIKGVDEFDIHSIFFNVR